MPRGQKRSKSDMLADIDAKIAKKQQELGKLKALKKEIEASQLAEVAAKVVKAAETKGVTIDDLLVSIDRP